MATPETQAKQPRKSAKAVPAAIYGTGKRKQAVARIKLATGKGDIVINEKPIADYFHGPTAPIAYFKAFSVLGLDPEDYTISIKTQGGGMSGQLDAVSTGIAKALLEINPEFRPKLKKARLLTRDARVKERRKYGLAGKARADKQRPKR